MIKKHKNLLQILHRFKIVEQKCRFPSFDLVFQHATCWMKHSWSFFSTYFLHTVQLKKPHWWRLMSPCLDWSSWRQVGHLLTLSYTDMIFLNEKVLWWFYINYETSVYLLFPFCWTTSDFLWFSRQTGPKNQRWHIWHSRWGFPGQAGVALQLVHWLLSHTWSSLWS